jgi:Flp pilus assembly protein TadD
LFVGTALFLSQDYDRALAVLRRGASATPEFIGLHGLLAVTYAEMGRMDEARAAVAEMLRINPEFSVEELASRNLERLDPESAERFLAAARKAGIPERRSESVGDDS